MMNEDISEKIEQLERAIKQLDAVKRHLLHNATEIKGQVQSTMSRHLEALRNREVWLLNQVDLVFSAKEAVLQAQQARINKMLGVLQSTIGLSSDSNMDVILSETLQKLDINLNDLNPEETAFFTFRADPVDLRNTILNYGQVDANGMPFSGAFHEPESETLPRHFEDYEGPDHHIFHKTVGYNIMSEEHGIYVNIPKLSTKPEDWLLRPTTTTTTTSASDTPKFSFPPFSCNSLDWIQHKSPSTPGMTSPDLRAMSSDASMKDWLCHIKQYSDPEEEDFEIVDNGLSTASSETYSSCSDISVKPPLANLDLVQLEFPSAVQTWLKSNKSSPEEKPSNDVLDYFQHIPSDPDIWLVHHKESKKTCDECVEKDCSATMSTDIETLGDRLSALSCQTNVMSNFYRSCPADKNAWLISRTEVAVPDVKDVCRANELCGRYEECVCKPHCGFQHIGLADTKQWLIKPDLKTDSNQNKAINCPDKWLSPSKCQAVSNINIAFPYFKEMSNKTSDWIQHQKQENGQVDMVEIFQMKQNEDEQKNWLGSVQGNVQGNHSNTNHMEESSIWNVIKDQHSKLDNSDWLIQNTKSQAQQTTNQRDKWLISH